MHGTFLKSPFIWQQTAKLKYSPSSIDQTTSSNMMIYNLETHLKVFSDIITRTSERCILLWRSR